MNNTSANTLTLAETELEADETSDEAPVRNWVTEVAAEKKNTVEFTESSANESFSYSQINGEPVLFLPTGMAEQQPRTFDYLNSFADRNILELMGNQFKPADKSDTDKKAKGMSMLLKQAGMPGAARSLSEPHLLNPDSPYFSLSMLIDMAAYSSQRAKKVKLVPNRITAKALNNDSQPIAAYGCNLRYGKTTTILSLFDAPGFRSIGYSAGNQYVLHLCLGGGTKQNAKFWVSPDLLNMTDIRFQLYEGKNQSADYGLFYTTLYIDLAQSPFPWWLENREARQDATNDPINDQGSQVA